LNQDPPDLCLLCDYRHESLVSSSFFFFFFFFGGTGVWTQGFAFANQVFSCLSHNFSPFCSGYFGDGVLGTMSQSW
jgi:hypothetical protein